MFKATQLTNVRAPKSTVAEVETTPTSGNIKLNTLASQKTKIGNGDYAVIVKSDEDFYIAKGHAGDDKNSNLGSKVSSSSGKNGGSLQFSSENAYQEMGGNDKNKRIFTVGDAEEHDGVTYFKLTFDREEEKVARKSK